MLRKILLTIAALTTLASTLSVPAHAHLSIDEARDACIARIRPQVRACVMHHMMTRGGPPRMYIAGCREPIVPVVRTCVFRTLRDSGHPLLAGRPLPGPDAICPLGFDGCMNRCFRVGGWGGAGPAHTCGRICARRCGPGLVQRELPEPAETAEPAVTQAVIRDWVGGY